MTNMKKVLLLHSSDDLYGASKIFLDVIRILKSNDFELKVYISGTGPLHSTLIDMGVEVHAVRMGALRRKYLNFWGLLNRLFFLIRSTIFFAKIIKEENCDIVYSNTTSIINGAILKLIYNRKIFHIWHIHEIIDNSRLFNWLLSKLMNYTDRGICVSDAVINHWKTISPNNSKKFLRIYNGFLPKTGQNIRSNLNVGDNSIIVTMIGRISKMKGPDFFVEIAKNCITSNSDLVFLIAGDCYPGNEHLVTELQQSISKHKKRIKFLGFRSDIDDILFSSDIFILPSVLPDPLPTVILEAMSNKLPIITTTTGGAGEMVYHEENGYHIDVWDVESASDYVQLLAKDPKRREEMGSRSNELLDLTFGIVRFEKELLALIQGK